ETTRWRRMGETISRGLGEAKACLARDMRFLRFLYRRSHDEDLARGLEAHLQFETDHSIAQRVAPHETGRRGRIRLGNDERIRGEVWEWNLFRLLECVRRDFRFAAQQVGAKPGSCSHDSRIACAGNWGK